MLTSTLGMDHGVRHDAGLRAPFDGDEVGMSWMSEAVREASDAAARGADKLGDRRHQRADVLSSVLPPPGGDTAEPGVIGAFQLVLEESQ